MDSLAVLYCRLLVRSVEDGHSLVGTPVWRPCGTPPLSSHTYSVSTCCWHPRQCTKTSWLRLARRHPIPVRTLASHTVASRVSQYVLAGQTVHSSRLLLFKGITATLACASRHSTSAVAVAVAVLLQSLCCAVHCLVLLMAACRQCCLAIPAGSCRLFFVALLLALSDCPLSSLSPILFWVRHGLTVPSFSVLLSRLFYNSGLSYFRVLVVVDASLWQTVRVLFSRLAALSYHR